MTQRTRDNEWNEWNGVGASPVDVHVDLRFRCGTRQDTRVPQAWRWTDTGDAYDIVAYRLIRDQEAS